MGIPIYKSIVEKLIEEIKEKDANTPIESERDLAVRFSASRMTVRKAINILVDDGYLYRDKNKGTFVAYENRRKINTTLNASAEVSNEIKYRVIGFDIKELSGDKYIVDKLDIKANDQIIRIVRKNIKEDKVQDIEEIYIVRKRIPNMACIDIDTVLNFSELIENRSITQKFIPMKVPIKYMNLMELDIDTPIIMIETIISNQRGFPTVFMRTFNNPQEKDIIITT